MKDFSKEIRVCALKNAVDHEGKALAGNVLTPLLAQLGAGADIFSSGELHLALAAGIRAENLLFNGSSKTPDDLRFAVEKGVRVSVDSLDELHQLDAAAKAAGRLKASSWVP